MRQITLFKFYPPPVWGWAVFFWLLMLTATPIAIWIEGDQTFPFMATLGVLAQAAATLLALSQRWSSGQIGQLMLILVPLTWLAEYIGSTTGFPFGDYFYTDRLQPQLLHVPVLIPFAWLMMLPPAWAITTLILQNSRFAHNRLVFAALAGGVFTAWDLYLDPQMVEKGLWTWENPSGYFGIPLINFFGWWLVSGLLTGIIFPRNLPLVPLTSIYALTWLFQAVGLGVFWGQPAPALCGFLAMGFFIGLAWKHSSGLSARS